MQSFTLWEDGLQLMTEKDGWGEELCQHRFRAES